VEAEIVFRWVSILGKGDKLEIASVKGLEGAPLILLDEVKLELNTSAPKVTEKKKELADAK